MQFNLKSPLDIRQWEEIIFYAALSIGAENRVAVTFEDSSFRQMSREAYIIAAHIFQEVKFGLREGWVVTEGFDPSQVVQIYFSTVATQTLWVDVLRFFRSLALTPITVESVPSGKMMELSGVKGKTPIGWQVSPGTYTLKAEPTGFIKWNDEITNPERSVTILVGEPAAFKAFYGSQPSSWPLALAIGGTIVGIAIVLYFYHR